jgi:ankyrin repeat protein
VGVNARDADGVPALSIAVQLRQPVLAASLLNAVDPRVEVDAATPSGYTALHFAVGSNDRNVVKALLRRGADPNAQITQEQSGGWGPLHFACRLGHLEIAKSLLDFDADPMLTGHAGENAFKVAEDAAVPYSTRKKIAGLLNEAMARRGGEL